MVMTALMCMALNIYHEARGEPPRGQLAVALVTMNRAKKEKKNVCREVFRPAQFSWTGDPDKRSYQPAKSDPAWKRAKLIAGLVLSHKVRDFTGGASHYHATYVRPDWARRMPVVFRFGNHKFYREA